MNIYKDNQKDDNLNTQEKSCEIMTVDEVASMLRVNKKTIYDAIARKEIPCQKIGRIFRFRREAVLKWLNGESLVSLDSRRRK